MADDGPPGYAGASGYAGSARTAGTVDDAVTQAAREDSGRIRATLARRFGDLDLADDAVQEALISALHSWPTAGIPDNPGGWLRVAAERKALDLRRRADAERRRLANAAADVLERPFPAADRGLLPPPGHLTHPPLADRATSADTPGSADTTDSAHTTEERGDADGVEELDDGLRLLLLCCHPALARDAQVALTLRLVGGLTTREIARAYLTSEATITQRIVRAKAKIRQARIPLCVPADLQDRLHTVLLVLYLVFNEGYLSSRATGPIDVDLADEAIRLTRVLLAALGGPGYDDQVRAPVRGLLALELFHRARFAVRFDARGALIRLEDQDRSQWDPVVIAQANDLLLAACAAPGTDRYRLMALIAGLHANAASADQTPWPLIAHTYTQLAVVDPSPVVALNHAVAVGQAHGPAAGLALLDAAPARQAYHLWHAVRADLLQRCGQLDAAAHAFARAAALAPSAAERAEMLRREELVSRLGRPQG